MERILILGCSGFLGAHLFEHFSRHTVTYGTFATRDPLWNEAATVQLLAYPSQTDHFLASILTFKPTVVFYCLDHPDPDVSVGTLRHFINVGLADLLAQSLEPLGVRMFYFSTSEVFSGKAALYGEEDSVEPATAFGDLKMRAEEILRNYPNVVLFRLPRVVGLSRCLPRFYQVIPEGMHSCLNGSDLGPFFSLCIRSSCQHALYHLAGPTLKPAAYFLKQAHGEPHSEAADRFKNFSLQATRAEHEFGLNFEKLKEDNVTESV